MSYANSATSADIDSGNLQMLVARVQAHVRCGASDASSRADFTQFVAHYQPIIDRFLRRLGVPKADIADGVQDVWVSVWRALPKYDPTRGRFLDWLYGMCRHKAADKRRKRARPGNVALSLTDLSDCGQEPCAVGAGVHERLECEEQRIVVLLGLVLLGYYWPRTTLEIFFQVEVQGRPVVEVAEEFHLTPKQVRDRNSRTRCELRRAVAWIEAEDSPP
jgi:RNA polymerase sigma factor (sigma-70 family)